jgi:hypothetical protein
MRAVTERPEGIDGGRGEVLWVRISERIVSDGVPNCSMTTGPTPPWHRETIRMVTAPPVRRIADILSDRLRWLMRDAYVSYSTRMCIVAPSLRHR